MLVFFIVQKVYGQQKVLSKYGVEIINNTKAFTKTIQQDSLKEMAELKKLVPFIVYDLKYAGENNFMKRRMYPKKTKETYLRIPAARALANVQQELKEKGYGLKIFDAYRPYTITVKFWELVKDERYVANPAKGSAHNRGLAVDLTIIDLKTGKELNMGTGFDNFTDTARHGFMQLPLEVLNNRKLLQTAMEKAGFKILETEWWHYHWPNDRNYEVLDLEFNALKKISR